MRNYLSLLSLALLVSASCHNTDRGDARSTQANNTTDTTCAVADNIDPVVCNKKRQEALSDYQQNKMKYYVTGFLPEKKFVQELQQLNVQVVATSCVAMNNGDGCYNRTVDSIVQAKTGTSIMVKRHERSK